MSSISNKITIIYLPDLSSEMLGILVGKGLMVLTKRRCGYFGFIDLAYRTFFKMMHWDFSVHALTIEVKPYDRKRLNHYISRYIFMDCSMIQILP